MESIHKTWLVIIVTFFIALMFSDYCMSKVKIEELKLQQIIYSNDGAK